MNQPAVGSPRKRAGSTVIRRTPTLGRLAAAILAVSAGLSGLRLPASAATAIDVETPGGAVVGAKVVHVTSLADSGAGSLREALSAKGPRVVLFDVSGYIKLRSNLPIHHGQVTVAGQTAPGPGVVIRGGSLQIRDSDVVIEHIAIYPGSSDNPKIAGNLDGISIYGSSSRKTWLENVVLRNVSVGWAVDENIGINGRVDGVKVERSLIAEGLMKGGHPKGVHSMSLLLGNPVRTVLILGNVFAASNRRNARLTQGNIVEFLNNYIYGFGQNATHIDSSRSMAGAARIDAIGNLYRRTADSRCHEPIIYISKTFFDSKPPSKVHLADNTESPSDVGDCADSVKMTAVLGQRLSAAPLGTVPGWPIVPSTSLYPGILDLVGSHPAKRNPIDARIVAGIRDGTERLIGNERDVGGWPPMKDITRPSTPPIEGSRIDDAKELSALTGWLCQRSAEAGGRESGCE